MRKIALRAERSLRKLGADASDIMCEIETDKATMEVEAVDEGKVLEILVAEGTQGVKVNAVIARIEGEGDAPSKATAAPAPAAATPAAAPTPVAVASAPAATDGSRIMASPLAKRIAETVGDAAPNVAVSEARDAVLAAVKSINFRAEKGQPFDTKCVTNVQAAIISLDRTIAELKAVKTAPDNQATFDFVRNELEKWRSMFSVSLPQIQQFGPAKKIPVMFPSSMIPDTLFFQAQPAKTAGATTWQRVKSTYEFKTSSFDRSFAKENGNTARVNGVSVYYEGKMQDGTMVRYFPHEDGVAFAMRGIIQIDAAGKGAASTGKVFDTIKDIDLDLI
jgi:hypothetical protein